LMAIVVAKAVCPAVAATIRVPEDHKTLQAAIAAASPRSLSGNWVWKRMDIGDE
jgi:hypothetical protein